MSGRAFRPPVEPATEMPSRMEFLRPKILALATRMTRYQKRFVLILSDLVLLNFAMWVALSLRYGEFYAPTGPDVAQAIRAGHGDCGLATRAVAAAAGLDFVPLLTEHFDILVRQRDSYRKPMQDFLRLLSSPAFAKRARELGGLDVGGAGDIRWAP